MARTLYGGGSSDVAVFAGPDSGDLRFDTTSAADAYTTGPARTGGTHMTDLAAFQPGTPGTPGSGVTTVVAQSDGEVLIWGPDPYNGPFWLQYASGTRRQLLPVDLVARLAALESAGGTAIPASIIDAEGDLIEGSGDNTYIRRPKGTALQYYRRNAGNTANEWGALPAPPDISGKVDKTGSITQVADVADTARADGDLYVDDAGILVPIPSSSFAAADPTTGDLDYAAFAPFMGLFFIKNAGDPDPAGLPLGAGIPILGYELLAAASIIPIFDDDGVATAANNLTLVTTQDYAVGEDLLLVVGLSDEAGSAGADATAVFTFSGGGPAAAQTLRISGRQNGSAKVLHYNGKCTVHIPVGTTVTVTFKDVTGVTTQNRVIAAAHLIKMPNLAATPFDQSVAVAAGGSGTLGLSIGPTGATALAREVAIESVFMSGGGPPAIRTVDPTSGWSILRKTEEDSGSSSRVLMTAYKVLSATGAVTGNYVVGASGVGVFDNQSGGHADVISTYKGT